MPRLGFEARFAIIDDASQALGVNVNDRQRLRVAAISDGFPHYIHLICEKLFWEMFNAPLEVNQPSNDHFKQAISHAVMGIEPHLRASYEKAVIKDSTGYEDTLWAMADHADLLRRTEEVYESYVQLFTGFGELLDRAKVTARLAKLKSAACDHVLASERPGYYHFRENIMRGYVRLRAEDAEVELATDFASGPSSGSTFRQRGARRSRGGLRPADWRHTDIPTE